MKILAPKGSIVFWDSRTFHKGTAPIENRVNIDRWRFVIYVCYTPARLQTDDDTEKKIHAYINNKCTTHWPYKVQVGGKAPDDYKINSISDLTSRNKKCLGITNA